MSGGGRGECPAPFLFAMFINEIEEEFINNADEGIEIGMMKTFLSINADDFIIFRNLQREYKKGLMF